MADNIIYQNTGSFIPTNWIWDVQQLYQVEVTSPEFKELLVRLYQNVNAMALVLNTKDSGYYWNDLFVNGQVFFPNPNLNSSTAQSPEARQVYRKVVIFPNLPAAGTISRPHGITCTSLTSGTRIYGAATRPTPPFSMIPLQFTSATAIANNIQIDVDDTNVNITTGGTDYSAYTVVYVVIELLQN